MRRSSIQLPTTRRRFLLLLLVGQFLSPYSTQALPAGFVDEGVARISGVVDIAFAGTDLLSVTKPGQLYRLDLLNEGSGSQLVIDLTDRICDNGERG